MASLIAPQPARGALPSQHEVPAVAPAQPAGPRVPWPRIGLAIAVLIAVAAWVPFLTKPLASDEAGYLLIAQQWHHGSSLYGDYWVDRPPLLLWLFTLADHLAPTRLTALGATAVGVKILGAVASGSAVLLTAALAHRLAPGADRRWHRTAVIAATTALLANPLLGLPEADGEILAVPFVLVGFLGLITATQTVWGRNSRAVSVAAGAAGMAAALIKQNVVDVFVLAAAVLLVGALGRARLDHPIRRAAAFISGALAVLLATVLSAAAKGTSAQGLWDAVVVFRIRASHVINTSASSATTDRMRHLAEAFLSSGAAVLLIFALTVVVARRRHLAPEDSDRHPPRGRTFAAPAVAVCAWESVGVVLGGSYWSHYLIGLAPGLVLILAACRPGPRQRRVLATLAATTVGVAAAVWGQQVQAFASATPSDAAQAMTYLRTHARSDDGMVVAYGQAQLVAGSGLTSPYENLWSLPVRVRDPALTRLRSVLSGQTAPRWMVLSSDTLSSWGLDADQTQQFFQRHYVEQVTYGGWHIWQRTVDASP